MPRWHIVRTLAAKEILRYRYNWGLAILVLALLFLAGLVSFGAKTNLLPGQADPTKTCLLLVPERSPWARAWASYLVAHPPAKYQLFRAPARDATTIPPDSIGIELPPNQGEELEVRYHHPAGALTGLLGCRTWFEETSAAFLEYAPRLVTEDVETTKPNYLPQILTGLLAFALYVLSFNLFITSTGEERDKRVLLAVLLSPARPSELVLAKLLFYSTASLAVSAVVVGMYEPALLASLRLWSALVFGSVAYLAIGTTALVLVRRQTTLSTVSLLYMLFAAVVAFVGSLVPAVGLLRRLFFEEYLYRQLSIALAGTHGPWLRDQVMLAGLAVVWTAIAIFVFRRRGLAASAR